ALLDTSSGSPVLLMSWRWDSAAMPIASSSTIERLVFGIGTSATTAELYEVTPKGTQQKQDLADDSGSVIQAWSVDARGVLTGPGTPTPPLAAWLWTEQDQSDDPKIWGYEVTLPLPSGPGPFAFFFEVRTKAALGGNARFQYPQGFSVINDPLTGNLAT